MKTLSLSLPKKQIMRIASNREFTFDDTDLLLLRAYLPGVDVYVGKGARADITVHHKESSRMGIVQHASSVLLHAPWKGRFSPETYHLLYALTRKHFLGKFIYAVHSACLVRKDGVLILGHSGAGKTSILLELVEEYRLKIFSGNKTLVRFMQGSLEAVAGTPTITVKAGDKKRTSKLTAQGVSYWDRYAFMLDPMFYEKKSSIPIKKIVVVNINDKRKECLRIAPRNGAHTLYPYFLDVVNADVVLGKGEGIFLGNPREGTQKKLTLSLKLASAKIPIYKISGSASSIAANIAKL